MDRFPLVTKTIMITAMLTFAACGGESERKSDKRIEFPASQAQVSNSNHTSLLEAAVPVPSSVEHEVMPIRVDRVVEPEPRVEPQKFSGFMHRGRTRFGASDFAGAKSDYQEAVAKRPESFRARVQLARTLLSLGEVTGAREQVEMAIEIDGASSLAWNTLGRIELAEHDHQAAIVSFERAVEENEDNSYAWNNLGFVHIEEKNFEAAVEALEAATSGASPTGYMWNNLGMAYEHLDQITLARASYRQAAERGSDRAQENFDRLEGVVSLLVEDGEEGVLQPVELQDEEPADVVEESTEDL